MRSGGTREGKRKPRVELLLLLCPKCHFLFVIHLLFPSLSHFSFRLLLCVCCVRKRLHVTIYRYEIEHIHLLYSIVSFSKYMRNSVLFYCWFVKVCFVDQSCCFKIFIQQNVNIKNNNWDITVKRYNNIFAFWSIFTSINILVILFF